MNTQLKFKFTLQELNDQIQQLFLEFHAIDNMIDEGTGDDAISRLQYEAVAATLNNYMEIRTKKFQNLTEQRLFDKIEKCLAETAADMAKERATDNNAISAIQSETYLLETDCWGPGVNDYEYT